MGIRDIIKNILIKYEQKNVKKLEQSKEEKIAKFKKEILSEISESINNSKVSDEERNSRKIYRVLSRNINQAIELGIIENKNVKEFSEQFQENDDIKKAVEFVEKDEFEKELIYDLNESVNSEEYLKKIELYIEKFFEKEDNFKNMTDKDKFDIINEVINRKAYEENIENAKTEIRKMFENKYTKRISDEKSPREVIKMYHEYVNGFLNGDEKLESNFRNSLQNINKDVLAKMDLMMELGQNFEFESMDKIPAFYDMTKLTYDETQNEMLAKAKENKSIESKDLVFIRTTGTFPKDGVVEPVGEYCPPEPIGNPLFVLEDNPELKILSPRFRWTTHWCVNGVVSSHLMGDFSGRDFFIIEEAKEHENDDRIINTLVADTIGLEDMKLSDKAKIVMSIEKYMELMQDEEMKEQILKSNIVLYKGDPGKAMKMYMNDNNYVWGEISNFNYSISPTDKSKVDEYLIKVEESLKTGSVKGFEHCAYASDEGLCLNETKNKEVFRKRVLSIANRTDSKVPSSDMSEEYEEKTIMDMSSRVDYYLCDKTCMEYVDYLSDIFPEVKVLANKYKKGIDSYDEEFLELSNSVFSKLDKNKLIEVTKVFNEEVIKRQLVARKEKDRKLLDEGLITQDEYDRRNIVKLTQNVVIE